MNPSPALKILNQIVIWMFHQNLHISWILRCFFFFFLINKVCFTRFKSNLIQNKFCFLIEYVKQRFFTQAYWDKLDWHGSLHRKFLTSLMLAFYFYFFLFSRKYWNTTCACLLREKFGVCYAVVNILFFINVVCQNRKVKFRGMAYKYAYIYIFLWSKAHISYLLCF